MSGDGVWRQEDLLARDRDDRAFEEARHRRHRRKPDPPPPDDGAPRCGRCRHWAPPLGGKGYGECRLLLWVERSSWKSAEAGQVEPAEDAPRLVLDPKVRTAEPLRTAAHGSCRGFEERAA